ncbi:hypothetical protein GCM10022419_111060 [Nonomuraea rosea]|uniref:Uncharacterized protein n=1 Tax=Nonomuraea rosea TaxID=638574 RepID=A0ABP6ZGK8_9ACTN
MPESVHSRLKAGWSQRFRRIALARWWPFGHRADSVEVAGEMLTDPAVGGCFQHPYGRVLAGAPLGPARRRSARRPPDHRTETQSSHIAIDKDQRVTTDNS